MDNYFSLTIQPRFAETDALGHIGNTILPVWFEAAREPLFKIIHPTQTIEDWPLILARQEFDYVEQMYLGAEITIKTRVGRIGNSSFDALHEAKQKDKVVAKGKAVMVYYDYGQQRSVTLPDSIRSQLEKYI